MVGEPETQNRFRTAVSVLIATVTVLGAVVGWRIAVASIAAGVADSHGLQAALRAANAGSSISTYLSTNLSFFAEYQEHGDRATLVERALTLESDPERRQALEEEALRERSLAAAARGYVNVDYIAVDAESGAEYFDGNRFWDAQWAETAVTEDLDPDPSFAGADQARTRARGLTAVAVGLSFALFLLSAASVAPPHRMRFLTAVAVLCLVAACVGSGLLEVLL